MVRVLPDQRRVVLSGGFDDAFPRGPYRAEGSHGRAVLAPEHDDVAVRLVQVVLNFKGREASPLLYAEHPWALQAVRSGRGPKEDVL